MDENTLIEDKLDNHTEGSPSGERCYGLRFRENERFFIGRTDSLNLRAGDVVMVDIEEKGVEPAVVLGVTPKWLIKNLAGQNQPCAILRQATNEEIAVYKQLLADEKEALLLCRRLVERNSLVMKLVKVECYFDRSKMIFYFTAEGRVDFRGLVRDLVREYKTRVEMRQIGVRHEAKLLGGVGCCGREYCCSSFLGNFLPVSIKMAKEQNLPLNPTKISGGCNRLLCCLTYEVNTYAEARKGMPKTGKNIIFKDHRYKVIHCEPLQGTIRLRGEDDKDLDITKEEWEAEKQRQ